jgi:hypothetical protein
MSSRATCAYDGVLRAAAGVPFPPLFPPLLLVVGPAWEASTFRFRPCCGPSERRRVLVLSLSYCWLRRCCRLLKRLRTELPCYILYSY